MLTLSMSNPINAYRTGTTFLSELVGSSLKDLRYFLYEPLMTRFRIHAADTIYEENEGVEYMRRLMKCDYLKIGDERQFIMNVQFNKNPGLWDTMWDPKAKLNLERFRKMTKDARPAKSKQTFTSLDSLKMAQRLAKTYCQMYPYQVVKVVRMRLKPLENLLSDKR